MGFAIDTKSASWAFKSGLGAALRLFSDPSIWAFLKDKTRFHTDAHAFLEAVDQGTVAQDEAFDTLETFCARRKYREAFVLGWLQPLCEAVWSTPRSEALQMEASTILTFLRNHGFLRWSTVQWYTPKGRTVHTVRKFATLFRELGVNVRCDAKVDGIKRRLPLGSGVELAIAGTAEWEHFDDVVIAAPAGCALKVRLLGRSSAWNED
jgi:predicted NAD/FAD-binding protein